MEIIYHKREGKAKHWRKASNEPVKLKDMRPSVPYIVVKGGSMLKKGDHVKLEMVDGSILCQEANGWLQRDDWKNLRNLVVVDIETVKDKIKKLKLQIDYWNDMLLAYTPKNEEKSNK